MEEAPDIIIVGAGTSGCVIAARLAAADPNLRILILESGPDTLNDAAVTTPARFLENLDPEDAPRTRFITSTCSAHLLNRETTAAAGHCVGGGSAINFMVYTRPAASDIDSWEFKHDNPGWGYKAMLPMFKKFETYEPLSGAPTHGYDGPIHISLGSPSPIAEQWLDLMKAYEKSSTFVDDFNDFSASNAFARWPKLISNGVRQDAAHRFLYPALEKRNTNISLRTGCTVHRVVFEGDVAVGVEYKDNTILDPVIINAKKLVVLSAGTLGSPLLLERSGIGSPTVLAAAGVPVKVALDGVGENYQDHNLLIPVYKSAIGVTVDRDAYLRGDPEVIATARTQYRYDGSGLFSANGLDAGAKIRPRTRDEAKACGLGEAFLENWSFFENAPDKPVFLAWTVAGITLPHGLPDGDYFSMISLTAYPYSRGSMHIRSVNVDSTPVWDPNYLSHPADVSPLMWQYKWSRERARRLPAYRGELSSTHPNFSPGSEAACVSRNGPVAIDAPEIVYTEEDDHALETWVRQVVQTTWHPLGTCAMKPRHLGGVVDSKLNVYGVRGLKIADVSIPPENVSCNTTSIALAIGEKAASIIANDLGISL